MTSNTPLAEKLRPLLFKDIIGQDHLVGKNGVIKRTVAAGRIPSLILWGPPGVGKTTMAQIIATETKRPFFTLSAINSGVKDIREVIQKASRSDMFSGGSPILFIDEIHRFSKSQQDSLLGAVEKGTITLIGATTENPSFEVIPALISRCQVYTLNALKKDDLVKLIDHAVATDSEYKKRNPVIKEYEALLRLSGGDARKLLNTLQLVLDYLPYENPEVTNASIEEIVKENVLRYDKGGEMHYDIISAFIKSIRGSDPNAAVYWLARMIESGEDAKFIARRLLISASEDIGMANPNALLLATNCFKAVEVVGYPECDIILSQCTVYLATSPKSNASYAAIKTAKQLATGQGNLPVPLHLRNAPTKLMKELGYGEEYKYSHAYPDNFVDQEFLPEEISGTRLYEPGNNPSEHKIHHELIKKWSNRYGY
ncbi:MAG: replication-associated recombination protein A [Salibacteraceae bacterium]